jgi:hypothetical protein
MTPEENARKLLAANRLITLVAGAVLGMLGFGLVAFALVALLVWLIGANLSGEANYFIFFVLVPFTSMLGLPMGAGMAWRRAERRSAANPPPAPPPTDR